MKKIIALFAAAAMSAACLTGCVKIIDVGTEGQYTGEVAFDAAADSGSDWAQIVQEISDSAKAAADLTSDDFGKKVVAVILSGEVTEFESKANGKKNALIVKADGFDGAVKVQIGSIYSGTAIRDLQTLKVFENFTNQTEWSQYAKALNAEVDAQVVAPLALDDSVVGKKVTITGAAEGSMDELTVTPVALTVE